MAKGNMKTIKRRIKSVGSTMQITKAMEMVASSKLRRAKAHAEAARPYFETQYELLEKIAGESDDFKTIFNEKREVRNSLFIVIAGDRGLAGGYNSNILKLAIQQSSFVPGKVYMISIGRKAVDYFDKRKYDVISRYPNFAENVKVGQCSDIANMSVEMFKSGEVDEVRIFYTSYVSALQQSPSQLKLLPLDTYSGSEQGIAKRLTTYDPSPEAVFNRIIPKFILSVVHCACVESFASEQCARRIAMESASDNAEEMIEKLSLQYNRARQEKITNEINEIVAGANAI